jgi:hypothetical protein
MPVVVIFFLHKIGSILTRPAMPTRKRRPLINS